MTRFSNTLRLWRKTRRFSQLELALEANVSARHISFLETGRARPSPEMIARLGEAMSIPMTGRNQMLTQAGFAARYPSRNWDDEEMRPVRAAIDHLLSSHAPFPAIALDKLWNVRRMNGPAAQLFAPLGFEEGGSLLALLDTDLFPQFVENWGEVAHHTASRLRLESGALGGIPELDQAAEKLSAVPTSDDQSESPVIPAIYRLGDLRLSLFSTISQFGTPQDLSLEDLRVEHFFPGDEMTTEYLRSMAAAQN